jgi:antitoxin component of MazEF toxin-antitoxin module
MDRKEMIRMAAECDRMMDEGKIPYVMAIGPSGNHERLAVTKEVMEDLGLEQGQTVSTVVMNAIFEETLKQLKEKIEASKDAELDAQLEEDFDFRKVMDDE